VTKTDKPIDWRTSFASGALPRGELWARIRERTEIVAAYGELIADTVIEKLVVTDSGMQVTTREGLNFSLNPAAVREAPNIVLAQGSYEPFELHLLRAMAKDAHVICDVGANIGWYALHIALQAPTARLHAFEPIPSTHARLTTNVGLNAIGQNVTANPFGLSNAIGEHTMFTPTTSGSPAASMTKLHPTEDNTTITCRFSTLDTYARDQRFTRLDLVKCDVEGAELMVLQGGLETIRTHKPKLLLELLRKWSSAFGYHPNDVVRLLGTLGYECYAIGATDLTHITEITDTTAETNYIFVVPDLHGPVRAFSAGFRR
jgi:FkbM family methyltransferase